MSTADELAKLDALQKQGVLSEAEFETAKARLLSPPTPSTLPATPSVPSVQAPGVPTRVGTERMWTVPSAPINVAEKPPSTRSKWIVGILCAVLVVAIAIAIPVAIHAYKASQCASNGNDCPATTVPAIEVPTTTAPSNIPTNMQVYTTCLTYISNVATIELGGTVSSSSMANDVVIISSYGPPVSTDLTTLQQDLSVYQSSPNTTNEQTLQAAATQLGSDCEAIEGA